MMSNYDNVENDLINKTLSEKEGFFSKEEIDEKFQTRNDTKLNTNNKTIVSAINELKTVNDRQDVDIKNLQTQVATNADKIKKNTSKIVKHKTNSSKNSNNISKNKADDIESSELDDLVDKKQDKTDLVGTIKKSRKTIDKINHKSKFIKAIIKFLKQLID